MPVWLWPSDQVVLDSPHSPDVLLARIGTAAPPWTFWLVYVVLAGLAWLMLMAAWWAGMGGARRVLSEVAGRSTGAAPPGAMDR
jgi:hypothetical protein